MVVAAAVRLIQSGRKPERHFVDLLGCPEHQQLVARLQRFRAVRAEHGTTVSLGADDLNSKQRIQRKIG